MAPGPVHCPHQLVLRVLLLKHHAPFVPHASLHMLHMMPGQLLLQPLVPSLVLHSCQPGSKGTGSQHAATRLLSQLACWAAWWAQVGVLLQQAGEACQR